jgi:hypothetical protein
MLSTVDLLVLTGLDQLLFILKIFFTFFTKQATLMRRSTVLELGIKSLPEACTMEIMVGAEFLGQVKPPN